MNRKLVLLIPFIILFLSTVSCNTASNQLPSLSVSPTSSSLNAGGTAVTFKATLSNTSGEIAWTLSPSLGTLSSNKGSEITYTPPETVAAVTTVTLTASLGNLTDSATLTINPVTAKGFTITGKVQDYSAGAASLEAFTFVTEAKVGAGRIEADGNFSITLTEPADNELIAAEKPCPEVSQTPATFNVTSVVFWKVVKDDLSIGDLFHASSPDVFADDQVSYTYVDRDVSVKGSCLLDGKSSSFDISFKQGWNLLLRQSDETSSTFTTPESVDLPWLFSPSHDGDTTPPTIVSVDPADGAKGVTDDASIIVTFSEPMNQAATEDAINLSLTFLDVGVTYSWNTDSTVLTIKPNDLLDYAAGDDPSIDPITYTFGFTDGAKDLAGNALDPFSSSFSTLKVIVISIYSTASLDGDILGIASPTANSTAASIRIGETGDSIARGFFSFDLTNIPSGVVADEVKLIINKEAVVGNPYTFSSMSLDHVIYGSSLFGDDYDTPILADLGIFDASSNPIGYLSSDVTLALNDDLANRESRGDRSQYRLSFREYNMEKGPANLVTFTSSDGPEGQRPFLNIVYYLP